MKRSKKVRTNRPRFKDKKGRFTTKKKWERENLPKRHSKKKREIERQGFYVSTGKRKTVEGESFVTPGKKYQYRVFQLPNFLPETIRKLVEKIEKEPRPHPAAMQGVVDGDDKEGDELQKSTGIFRFNSKNKNIDLLSQAIYDLVLVYELKVVTDVTILMTYDITNERKTDNGRIRPVQQRNVSKTLNRKGRKKSRKNERKK